MRNADPMRIPNLPTSDEQIENEIVDPAHKHHRGILKYRIHLVERAKSRIENSSVRERVPDTASPRAREQKRWRAGASKSNAAQLPAEASMVRRRNCRYEKEGRGPCECDGDLMTLILRVEYDRVYLHLDVARQPGHFDR